MPYEMVDKIHQAIEVVGDDSRFLAMGVDELTALQSRLSVYGIHLADVISSTTKLALHAKGMLEFQCAKLWTEERMLSEQENRRMTKDDIDSVVVAKAWGYKEKLIDAEALEKKMYVILDMLKYTINSIKDRIKVVMAERHLAPHTD